MEQSFETSKNFKLFQVNGDLCYNYNGTFESIIGKDLKTLPYQILSELIVSINGSNIFKWNYLYGQRLYNFVFNYFGCVFFKRVVVSRAVDNLIVNIYSLEDIKARVVSSNLFEPGNTNAMSPLDARSYENMAKELVQQIESDSDSVLIFMQKYEQNKNWILLEKNDTFSVIPIVQNVHKPLHLKLEINSMGSMVLRFDPSFTPQSVDPEYLSATTIDELASNISGIEKWYPFLTAFKRPYSFTNAMRKIVPMQSTERMGSALQNVATTIENKLIGKKHNLLDRLLIQYTDEFYDPEFGKRRRAKVSKSRKLTKKATKSVSATKNIRIVKQENLPEHLRNKPIRSKFLYKGQTIVVKKWGNGKRFVMQ